MADLASLSIAEQLGLTAADPLHHVDIAGQYLITGRHGLPANTVSAIAGGYACCLAPNRLLAITAAAPHGTCSNVSHGMAVFAVDASHDSDFWAMGCALPLTAISPGRCAQTIFAGVKLLAYRHDGVIRLHVERPLASHLLCWFRQAATAF